MSHNSDEDGNFQPILNGDKNYEFSQDSVSLHLKSIAVNDRGGLIFIPIGDILLLEGRGNYTSIHCVKQLITSSSTLKRFQEKLDPDSFIRVHKSYIVNIKFIKRYTPKYGGEIELLNGLCVSVSRRNRHLLDRYTV